jgi:hypothetical protein
VVRSLLALASEADESEEIMKPAWLKNEDVKRLALVLACTLSVCLFMAVAAVGVWWVRGPRTHGANGAAAESAMTFQAYTAQRPRGAMWVDCYCHMNHVYLGSFREAKSSHVSIYLKSPDAAGSLNGYVPRDSPLGERLWEMLADGEWHRHELLLEMVDDDEETVNIKGVR